jgi:hypothetical protein
MAKLKEKDSSFTFRWLLVSLASVKVSSSRLLVILLRTIDHHFGFELRRSDRRRCGCESVYPESVSVLMKDEVCLLVVVNRAV